uniref:Uncharacterized protein n=1 Tax=Aplanochytrium stocchinoi TaxID=215587 RepID=A0A7S3V0V2_9STRA|mmetsp:Transcript_4198/g.4911  ORF Transcript_4198/g.4911 Transcript_4198/m.4911 type:complete len:380 (-) Transcript_4198:224-1363(-)
MQNCLEFWPAPKCGWNGRCVALVNETREYCECDEGWFQTLEMNFFVEETSLSSSLCMYNEKAVKGLYLTIMIVYILNLFLSLGLVKNRNQLFRRRHFILFSCVTVSACIYRILDAAALLGVDFTFSFLISISLSFNMLAAYQYAVNTLQYSFDKAIKVGPYKSSYLLQRLEKVKTFLFYIFFVSCIQCNCFWISTFTSNKISLILVRTLNGGLALLFVILLIIFYFVETEVINDLKGVSSLPGSRNAGEQEQNDIVLFALVTIPKIKRLRRDLVITLTINFLIVLFIVLSNYWFLLYVIILPIFLLNAGFGNFAVILFKYTRPSIKRKVNEDIKRLSRYNAVSEDSKVVYIPRPVLGFQSSTKYSSTEFDVSTYGETPL